MLNFTVTGDEAVIRSLASKQTQLLTALKAKLDVLNLRLQQKIQNEKLSGQVLKQRSGKLKRSIEVIPAVIDASAGTVTGGVRGAGGTAFYGRLFEEGTTSSYTITPVTKKALRWMQNGKAVFAMHVTHPAIARRPFMQPSLDEMHDDIVSGLQDTVDQVVKTS